MHMAALFNVFCGIHRTLPLIQRVIGVLVLSYPCQRHFVGNLTGQLYLIRV